METTNMKNCILCGKPHKPGSPCDFTGADPILAGKITIPQKEQRKPGRPPNNAK